MHFAGTGSKAGTILIEVNKSFNIHITVNEYYRLSGLIKGEIKNECINNIILFIYYNNKCTVIQCYGGEAQKHTSKLLF